MQIQAKMSLKEWENYQKGEEAIAYNEESGNDSFIHVVFDEKELITIENDETVRFIVKKEF